MLYVISGCSGGGKTALVDALASSGFDTSSEPGRTIVREELDAGGVALPWTNPIEFAHKCVELSVQRYTAAKQTGKLAFFDRSLVDAISALVHVQPHLADKYLRKIDDYRYARKVFMAPPWVENFENDAERKHSFKSAVAEYDRLVHTYTQAQYSILILPKVPVNDRIDFILKHIE